MNYLVKLRQRWVSFLHNEALKEKIYSIVFESDTPKGKLFDIVLIGSIILSILLVILESMHFFPYSAYVVLRVLEYLLTLFFTVEYLARIYCLKQPFKYIFSFFGVVDENSITILPSVPALSVGLITLIVIPSSASLSSALESSYFIALVS